MTNINKETLKKLSELCAEKKFAEALQIINELLATNKNDIMLLNQKSLVEKKLGHFFEAEKSLQEAIKADPDYAASYNNLGSLYYQQGKFQLAENFFEKALTIQTNYIDALYNLALSYKAQNKIEECAASLSSVCKINPNYIPAHFLLAKTLLEKQKVAQACERLIMLADISNNSINVLSEIIKLLLDNDRFLEAESFCLQALKQEPSNYRLLYNLGVINEKKRNIHQAIHYYLHAIEIKPDSFEALNNLGVLYLETQQVKTARFYLEKAAQLAPNNKPLQHTLAAISGDKTVDHASKEYIASLFDQHADTFEDHLLTSLEYKVPELLLQQIQQQTQANNNSLRVLDLGCGTGLFGQIIKPYSKQLIGIDLSKKMLAKAKNKLIYDELLCEEMLSYLSHQHQAFDLIAAADVFVYSGNLDRLFAAAKKALAAKGYLSFSLEITDGNDYFLAKSGRFHHSQQYIKKLIKTHDFKLLDYQQANTRMQHHQAAIGGLYLLKQHT